MSRITDVDEIGTISRQHLHHVIHITMSSNCSFFFMLMCADINMIYQIIPCHTYIVSGTWRSQIVDVRAFAAYKCALFYQHAPDDSFRLNITHYYDNHDHDEESSDDDDGRNKKQEMEMVSRHLKLKGSNDIMTLKWLRGIALLEWILDFIPDTCMSTTHTYIYLLYVLT
jgi:hypothetical protein